MLFVLLKEACYTCSWDKVVWNSCFGLKELLNCRSKSILINLCQIPICFFWNHFFVKLFHFNHRILVFFYFSFSYVTHMVISFSLGCSNAFLSERDQFQCYYFNVEGGKFPMWYFCCYDMYLNSIFSWKLFVYRYALFSRSWLVVSLEIKSDWSNN